MKTKYLIEVYQDASKEWRWRIKRQGRIVADSAEGYKTRAGCKKTLLHIITGIQENNFGLNT